MYKPKIAPSLLAGDFGHLAEEAKRATDAGADRLHLDVMDGHFVKNLSMGPAAVAAVNRATDAFLDVHLMIYNPYDYIERFVEAGADSITIHFEATEDVEDTLNYIRKCSIRAGLALCPETSVEFVPKYAMMCDLILLMTVHPGFGGQAFLPEVLEKIRFTREMCNKRNLRDGGREPKEGEALPPFDIQVDGGINVETAQQCFDAGANVFVAGTHLFGMPDMKVGIEELRGIGELP